MTFMTQARALEILKTGANVFLTGEPGSGKSFVTNAFVSYLKRAKIEVAVTASTGIAATHIGGRTIHSWSGIGIKRGLSKRDTDRIASSEWVSKRIEKARVLIIDEISMLDGATLTSIDRVCKEVKRNTDPFGGLQVVFVGDFFQLPPVVRRASSDAQGVLFEEEPSSVFAFASKPWQAAKPIICYLSEQHRQEDQVFSTLLSSLRRNRVSEEEVACLETCRLGEVKRLPPGALKLYSHNVDVDRVNTKQLAGLSGKPKTFKMQSVGKKGLVEQLKRGCLSPEKLELKEGASVMFTKNSPKGAFVNGTLGTVMKFEQVNGYPVIKTREGRIITTEPMSWSIEEHGKVAAQVSQIPLRLAWAMTVHKSQGMSLDAAVIDLRRAFVEGQGYVALSRVRTLKGLSLLGWNQTALEVHPEVLSQDELFRDQSLEAEEAFGDLPEQELTEMHEAFVEACDGKMPSASQKTATLKDSSTLSRYEKIREKHPNAYKPWKKEEDALLKELHKAGHKVKELSKKLGRQPGAIRSRVTKLELV